MLTPKQKKYLTASLQYTQTLLLLTRELLHLSHVKGGLEPGNVKPLDLGSLIQELVEEFKITADNKKIALTVTLPGSDLPPIKGDKNQLKEIFHRLIDNAIKYSPPERHVTISTQVIHRDNKPHLRINVEDQGIGIPAAEQTQVFQRFFRASNALAHSEPGSGLGLHIAKTLIEQMGGQLEFSSSPDKGTVFSVTFPTTK